MYLLKKAYVVCTHFNCLEKIEENCTGSQPEDYESLTVRLYGYVR